MSYESRDMRNKPMGRPGFIREMGGQYHLAGEIITPEIITPGLLGFRGKEYRGFGGGVFKPLPIPKFTYKREVEVLRAELDTLRAEIAMRDFEV